MAEYFLEDYRAGLSIQSNDDRADDVVVSRVEVFVSECDLVNTDCGGMRK